MGELPQQAGEFCIGVFKSFTVTGRTLSHKLMTWTPDAFNEWRANAPLTSLEHLVGVPLNRDYWLGTTLLDRYEVKISTGRQMTRTVNELLLDSADLLHLTEEAGVDIIHFDFEDTGVNWQVANLDKISYILWPLEKALRYTELI